MKANELMIGDWVCHKDCTSIPIRVCRISERVSFEHSLFWNEDSREYVRIERYSEADCDEITPIPLTPEILEKNGFTKGGMFGKTYYLAVEDFEISVYFAHVNTQLIIEKRNGREIINMLNAEYLHILQHALRLCGIEKQIEL